MEHTAVLNPTQINKPTTETFKKSDTQGSLSETKMLSDIHFIINYASTNDMKVSDEELLAYVKRDKKLNPGKSLKWMELDVDGEEVGIHYGYKAVPFDRIRRITGYLVGTLDRFNDAKRSEEHDRVKHGVSCSCGH